MANPSKPLFYYSVTLAYLAILVVGGYFHEYWRDEAFTWLIMDAHNSLADITEKLAYVGHPKVWYVLIYGLKMICNSHLILPISNTFFMTIAIFLFLKYSPFTNLQKLLFALGFFPVFQYGLIVRPYGLIIMLLFAWCAIRPLMFKRPISAGLIIAALASLHAHTLMYCIVILFIEFIYCIKSRQSLSLLDDNAESISIKKPTFVIAIIIILMSFAWTVYQLIPPESQKVSTFTAPQHLFVFKSFANAFFPNFHILHRHLIIQTAAGLILWALSWPCFFRKRLGFGYYFLWTLSLALFTVFIYKGYRWHHGFYFLFFVMAYWIGNCGANFENRQTKYARYYITILFFIQAMFGMYALTYDIATTCSSGRPAAAYMKGQDLTNLPKVGIKVLEPKYAPTRYKWEIDELQSTMVYMDDKNVYDPNSGKFERYWVHYADPEYFPKVTIEEIMNGLKKISMDLKSDLLVLVIRPTFTNSVELPTELVKLKDFPNSLHYGESVSLYLYKNTL